MQRILIAALACAVLSRAEVIKGVVTSTLEEKLEAVKVTVKGDSAKHVFTDKDGAFTLDTEKAAGIAAGPAPSRLRWPAGDAYDLAGRLLESRGRAAGDAPGAYVLRPSPATPGPQPAPKPGAAATLVFAKAGFQGKEMAGDAAQAVNAVLEYADPRAKAVADFRINFLGTKVTNAELAWTGDTAKCLPGTISDLAQARTLQRLNYFRRMAGLQGVVFLPANNVQAQAAALLMHANGTLDHAPPTTWKCFDSAGSQGAGRSNLAGGSHSSQSMAQYLADEGGNNTAVGHRRWMLYPRMKNMGHGSTTNYDALYSTGPGSILSAYPAGTPAFTAWPPAGFVAATLVYARWSFSVPKLGTANVDLSAAKVEMTGPGNTPVTLTQHPIQNGYGDATVVFEPQGIPAKPAQDMAYTVKVAGVKGGNAEGSYTYTVTVFPAPTQ